MPVEYSISLEQPRNNNSYLTKTISEKINKNEALSS